MIRICEQCSAEFEGGKNAHYCPVCRQKRFKEAGIKGNPKKAATTPKKTKKQRKRRDDGAFCEERKTWTVEFIRTREGWMWKAQRGKKVSLKSAGYFYSITGAKKDYEQAIGG